jgi:hypothetical protein
LQGGLSLIAEYQGLGQNKLAKTAPVFEPLARRNDGAYLNDL